MSQFMGLVHNLVLEKMEKGELNFESKEALRNVLQEYEIHTKIIEDQLEICKRDHAELRDEMNRLIVENQELYERLRRIQDNTNKPTTDSSDAIQNLKKQLALALEEKDTMEAMWKTSLQEAESLKDKLQDYQSGKQLMQTQNKLQDIQKDYTEAIRILENKLSVIKAENDQLNMKNQFIEDQLKQVLSQLNSVTEKNLALNNSLKEATEREEELKTKYLNLETKYIELERVCQAEKIKYAQIYEYEKAEKSLKERLEGALRQRDELQTALERCQDRMAEHLRTTALDRARVEEAVALVEGATRERDQALARENLAIEEVKKLKAELERLVDEAAKKVVQEEASIRRSYDSQLALAKEQLQRVEQERNRYQVEVDQLKKECDRQQALVKEAQHRDRLNSDQVSRELRTAENTCQKLSFENEKLREMVEKLEDRIKRNSQHKQKLKSELSRLVKNTQYYQQELAASEQKADLLSSQLQLTSLDLAKLQSKTVLNREGASLQPQVSCSTLNAEMLKKLNECYDKMNDKWKSEMNAITDQFEAKLKKNKKKSEEKSKTGNNTRLRRDLHNK